MICWNQRFHWNWRFDDFREIDEFIEFIDNDKNIEIKDFMIIMFSENLKILRKDDVHITHQAKAWITSMIHWKWIEFSWINDSCCLRFNHEKTKSKDFNLLSSYFSIEPIINSTEMYWNHRFRVIFRIAFIIISTELYWNNSKMTCIHWKWMNHKSQNHVKSKISCDF